MHINLDMLKTRRREDIFINACIQAKQPFVVDNTNATKEERKKYIDIARSAGFTVVGYYMQSNINEAIKRNEGRQNKEHVPPKGIAHTYKKLIIPTYDEGFDKLYYVRIDEANNFVVEVWQNEL